MSDEEKMKRVERLLSAAIAESAMEKSRGGGPAEGETLTPYDFEQLPDVIARLKAEGASVTSVFLEAADDVIVIAGKGHEAYQEIQGIRHPFSDVDQTRAALETWNEAQGELS